MNTVRSVLLLLAGAVALLAPAAAQARGAPIVTFQDIPISATAEGKPRALEQVKRAIMQAASSKNWTAVPQNANTVRATYTRGKHSAVVDIVYSETSYSIKYVDSHDLGYTEHGGKFLIHPSYNKAVTTLRQHIDAALRTVT